MEHYWLGREGPAASPARRWPDWLGLQQASQLSQTNSKPPVEAPSVSRARLRRPTLVRELARNEIRHSPFLSLSKKRKAKAQFGIAQRGEILSETWNRDKISTWWTRSRVITLQNVFQSRQHRRRESRRLGPDVEYLLRLFLSICDNTTAKVVRTLVQISPSR
jgi:hypothetical protein